MKFTFQYSIHGHVTVDAPDHIEARRKFDEISAEEHVRRGYDDIEVLKMTVVPVPPQLVRVK